MILKPSWAALEAKLAVLGPTWRHLGAKLGGFWIYLVLLEATQDDFREFHRTIQIPEEE